MTEPTIDAARLHASLVVLAQTSVATPLAACARERFARCCRDAGCKVAIDAQGNIVARRAGRNDALAPVVVAGAGGVGAAAQASLIGVLAALEAIRALNDAGIQTERPIEAWLEARRDAARAVHAFFEARSASASASPSAPRDALQFARYAALPAAGTSDAASAPPDALFGADDIEAGANALLGAILVQANELPDVFTSNATQALA